jgi:hypothetical protein
MKIAVSGSHCSGKTTLVEALSHALPTHEVVDEPYYLLEEEGHQFAEVPSLEDFELQLDRSIQCIVSSATDSLFERCPVDFLAYLFVHRDFKGFDVATWLPRVQDAVEQLDLIVFVPVEDPDRILVPHAEHPSLRRRVDEQLRKFLFDDPWEFQVSVLEVTGASGERARRVLAYIGGTGA